MEFTFTQEVPPSRGRVALNQDRAGEVIDGLYRLATRLDRRIMVRLVKGAYWDSEIKRAQENGEPFEALVERMIAAMHEDEARLNVLRPDIEPRATGHIAGMHQMIQTLIDKGYAYAPGNGDVYYRVTKFETYGKLSRRKIDELKIGARIEVDEIKEDPLDFVLWKGAKPGEPSWPTPWGPGRPGWHLECSAMSTWYLGPEFDIHGGGLDLQFPHHENEQAQSHAAGDKFARIWMHNHWVTMAGEKMSKSLGNVLSIDNMLEDVRPVELRYYLGSAHYRSVLEYSPEALQEAAAGYRRIEEFVKRAGMPEPTTWTDGFAEALNDDFSVPKALAEIHNLVREGNKAKDAAPIAAQVRAMAAVLGVDPGAWPSSSSNSNALNVLVEAELERRATARAEKDWATADEVRDRLARAGIEVTDTADGPQWQVKE